MSATSLRHPLLRACGVAHGFGVRGAPEPPGLLRPRQVHGRAVATVSPDGSLRPPEADAVVSVLPGRPVAVVTADCVPILAATRSGRAVAAIHAGWRGLAAGVIEAGIEALRSVSEGEDVVAVVGPHIGRDAYEVDTPVLDALEHHFGADLAGATRPSRPGHAQLALAVLARHALSRSGVAHEAVGELSDACTFREAERFHSYRRDGARAGRMVHHVAAAGAAPKA